MNQRASEQRPGTRAAAQAAAFVLFPLLLALPAAGCRSNCDLVEAELRTKDRNLHELRDELKRLELYNDAMQREIRALRRHTPAHHPAEECSLVHGLRSVGLGRQTGGYDDDDCPGDEALQVVLEPRDVDNHLVKAPGTLEVRVLEVSPEGLKKPLNAWQVTPDQLRRNWRSGLLSTGYYLVLPWKAWPTTEKVRVVALFTLADGRTFEADKDVSIRLTPAARRKPLPPDVEGVPGPIEQTPPPRRLDPYGGADPAGFGGPAQILPPRPRR